MNKSKSKSPKVATLKRKQRKSPRQPKQSTAAVAYNIPTRNNPSKHGIIVTRDEFVGYVNGSSQFTVTQYPINPGLDQIFPWLSTVASSFEFYRFKSISFKYIGRGSSSNPGDVILAVDLDPVDPAPTSARVLEAYAGRVSTGVWTREPVRMSIAQRDLAERQKMPLYTRAANIASTDLKTYDLGNLYVATSGCENTDPIGKLYVEYTCELSVPQMANTVQSLSFLGQKLPTANVTGTFANIPISQGLTAAQNEFVNLVQGLKPAELANIFGLGNVKGILEAAGRLSSGVAGLSPMPGSDADPYVLQFEHDFHGRISLDFDLLVINNSSTSPQYLKTRTVGSNSWPYYTLPPTVAQDALNYEFPFGSPKYKTSSVYGYATTPHLAMFDAGVGNTCSWNASHITTSAPVGWYLGADNVSVNGITVQPSSGWYDIKTDNGTLWFGLKGWQACYVTVHVDVDITALSGECFSGICTPNPNNDASLYYAIMPRWVNSSSGVVTPTTNTKHSTVSIYPTYESSDYAAETVPTVVSDEVYSLIANQAKLRWADNPEHVERVLQRIHELRTLKTPLKGIA